MRVIYIGQLQQGDTCLERMRVLEEFGWSIVPFNIKPYLQARSRILSSVQHRLLLGPGVSAFNNDVISMVRNIGAVDIIWVDKGRWLRDDVLDDIKQITGAIAIHYTPDPAFTFHTSRYFKACLPIYDLCVTTKRYELSDYSINGAKDTLFTLQGIDDRFERLSECQILNQRPIDLMFIGHKEQHYIDVISHLMPRNNSLRVYGPGWSTLGQNRKWHDIVLGSVWGDDYVKTLAKGKIGLGLLSKFYPDAFTTRSFEIPAAGSMLIAERTAEHQELFEEDKEAIFFDTKEELSEKISFYLAHDSARIEIAKLGRYRTLSNYHWRHVLKKIIIHAEALVNGK